MGEDRPWYQRIRDIHDEHFDAPWQERADAINKRFGLCGSHKLVTHGPGIPPPWFIGDIEAVVPGRWVLAVSLNHQVNPDAPYFRSRLGNPRPTPDSYWDYCRNFNRDHCYRRFFGPLAQVAAAGLGESLPSDQECTFATNRMIFTEICPYGSNKFNLGWAQVEAILKTDDGFRLAREVDCLLIEAGEPALVMVNGATAVEMFERVQGNALAWQELRYESPDAPREGNKPKRLRHFCGRLQSGTHSVPIVGFPFLRRPRTHNSNCELDLLGHYAFRCVEGHCAGGSSIGDEACRARWHG
jgi:hypothetical protein